MEPKPILSNHVGPDGRSVDRLYGSISGKIQVVNKDYTVYNGTITKKSFNDNGFRNHCYVTDDGRWFDRAGYPMIARKDAQDDE